ncbi:MAG: DEAD/DEAH box helicase [Acidobacteria bacterium]|nr:DEAD/DEAH box helicase [Acidobacteriota bacterium]
MMKTDIPVQEDQLPGFDALGLTKKLVDTVIALGYEEPTPIQRETIPILVAGHDLLGQAATGTGKTAAFALPMLNKIALEREAGRRLQGLVLVPTRELAMQVAEAIHKYGKLLGLGVVPVYGGSAMDRQIRALRGRADVIVATPGRAIDHIKRGTFALDAVKIVVLDEADEMLDMGFAEDLETILKAVPPGRQTALFSATMPPRIASIAQRHLRNPKRITIAREKTAAGKMPRVRQTAYIVARAHKAAALGRVLETERPKAGIVFCRTRAEVDNLTDTLSAYGYRAEALHGGMVQRDRDKVMNAFREGDVELLIATDVAARGLDIEHLSHVFNYDVPAAAEGYVHRIGRTGRVGRSGVAITFVEPREHRLLRNIEALTRQKIEIATLPTVADLRTQRLDMTRAALRELLLAGGFDDVRVVVESLTQEFDVVEVANAAVKMAHNATSKGDDQAIPALSHAPGPASPASKDRSRDARGSRPPGRLVPQKGRGAAGQGKMVRIYIGGGRKLGIGPGDIVGAITGEAGISGRALGAINMTDKFATVEVPEEQADAIVRALRTTTIKGQKVTIKRDGDDR